MEDGSLANGLTPQVEEWVYRWLGFIRRERSSFAFVFAEAIWFSVDAELFTLKDESAKLN
jgi:hypothetical protein